MDATFPEIVGRDEELADVAAFVDAAREPAGALLLEGDAGIGKTTLWRGGAVAARAAGFAVLETRPGPTESAMSFAGLADLLADAIAGVLGELPPPQRRALEVALLLNDPGEAPPDQRAISTAFLGALRVLARDGAVVVAIDDVQWLDAPSAAVLDYGARRLRDEPVAFLLARRLVGDDSPLGLESAFGERLRRLRVGPLGLDAMHRLLHDRLETALPRPRLRRIHEASGGNPFFALELARALEAHPDRLRPDEPLPVPGQLHQLVRDRLAALPSETQAVLAAAAALSQPTPALAAAAAGAAAEDLDPAVEANIVELDGGRIGFTHPLLASGAYGALPPTRRAALHARLAEVVVDVEERARHLAAAAAGPDAAVAASLDEAARRAGARGATAAAAGLCEQAARLTPQPLLAEARRRLIAAATYHFESGDSRRARELLEDVLPSLAPGSDRARALTRLARIRSFDDDIRAAVELFEQAVAEADEDDEVRAEAHEGAAGSLFRLREEFAESVAHARAAVEICRKLQNSMLLGEALGVQLLSEASLGHEGARATLVAALAVQAESEGVRIMMQPKLHAAVCWMWWDELPRARAAYEELLLRAREIGDESSVPYLLVLLGQAECAAGAFAAAAGHADEGLELAEQAGQQAVAAYLLALRALAGAHAGPTDAARTDAFRALEIVDRTAGRPAEYLARWALGLTALACSDADDALRQLAPLVEHSRQHGFSEPGATRFVTDAVEAFVETGSTEQAVELLDWYEGNAVRLGRASAIAASARCRALVAAERGDLDEAVVQASRALVEHERAPLPFERARTLATLGTIQRRAKRKAAARDALEEAVAAFESLGAGVWAAKSRAEMARIGGRAPAAAAESLTPTEQRVAVLVAQGLTNREVGAALFITPRTVEGHLTRIYAKLGVRSRAALAHRLGSAEDSGSG